MRGEYDRIYWVELNEIYSEVRNDERIVIDKNFFKWSSHLPKPIPIDEDFDGFEGVVSGNKFVNFNTLLRVMSSLNIPRNPLKRAKRELDRVLVNDGDAYKIEVKRTQYYSLYLCGKKTDDLLGEEGIFWI